MPIHATVNDMLYPRIQAIALVRDMHDRQAMCMICGECAVATMFCTVGLEDGHLNFVQGQEVGRGCQAECSRCTIQLHSTQELKPSGVF